MFDFALNQWWTNPLEEWLIILLFFLSLFLWIFDVTSFGDRQLCSLWA